MQEVIHTERSSEIWSHCKLGASLNSATTSVTLDYRCSFLSLDFILCRVSTIDIRAMAWHFKDEKPGKSFQILFFNHLLPKSFTVWTFFSSPNSYVMMMIFTDDSFSRVAFHNLLKLKGKCGTWSHSRCRDNLSRIVIVAAGVLDGFRSLFWGI